MRFLFLGGLHWDPRCSQVARDLLADLDAGWHGDPAFVAVEWDHGIKAKLEAEREFFTNRWKSHRQNDPDDLAGRLAGSIAWEADAHDESYPTASVVYLDDDRNPAPSAEPLAKIRLSRYQQWLTPPHWTEVATDDVLPRLNSMSVECSEQEMAAIHASGIQRDPERDLHWKSVIDKELIEANGDWALVIVGAVHASSWDGQTLFSLLSNEHECEHRFLVWEPVH